MDKNELKNLIEKIEKEFIGLVNIDDIALAKKRIKEIENQMLASDFYSDQDRVKKYSDELKKNRTLIDDYEFILNNLKDLKDFLQLVSEEDYNSLVELNQELKSVSERYNDLETRLVMNDEYDDSDAIVEIHCGAGGTESQDWVEMLYKMYLAYLKKKNYKIELIAISPANDIGIKSVTFKVIGDYAYGLLKYEKGVHRLIRISPFDSSSRRHTTFALVSISPVLDEIEDIEVLDKDLEIDTFRASGSGGQSVNTSDSAVRIVHKPSKIVVTCQNQRSQLQNKKEALSVLKSKLLEKELENKLKESRSFNEGNVDVNFGSQIRTYVFHPYALVKDHRSNYEHSNPDAVLSGDLDDMIKSLRNNIKRKVKQ